MVKLLKKEKVEFDVGHTDFCEKFEKLEEAYKAWRENYLVSLRSMSNFKFN
jgi:hypothetical protein